MARLATESYLAARRFLYDRGRELERLVFEHEFEGAPAWPVFDALARYQNADGGFGHGLEPDSVTTASGALATSVALKVLADLQAPATHPLVAGAVSYLRATLMRPEGTWRIIPPEAALAPHAPWWEQEGLAEGFGGFELNPRADIVAQLTRLAAGTDLTAELLEDVLAVAEARAADGLEMHDMLCCARLLDALPRGSAHFERLRAVLEPAAAEAVAAVRSGGYGPRALNLAPLPSSALAAVLADSSAAELQSLIGAQAEEGAWWPVWDWGDDLDGAASAAWEKSRVAWAGMLTLEALRSLAAAGLVDRG